MASILQWGILTIMIYCRMEKEKEPKNYFIMNRMILSSVLKV